MPKKQKKQLSENLDKYERQKKLAAERQRRFKERMTEEQLEKKRERDRERRRKLRQEKIIKPIAEMKSGEQKKMRKQWKKYSATYRDKQQNIKNALQNTPPSSNGEESQEVDNSRQKERGRKHVRRDRAKAYRTISKQAEEITKLQRMLEKYKKRLQREKNKSKTKCSPSPAKKVKSLVGSEHVSPKIKKRLFVGYALEKQLEAQLKGVSPKGKERQIMTKVIGSKILKKYRVQRVLQNVIPYKYNKVQNQHIGEKIDLEYTRKQYVTVKIKEAKALRKFYEDDSVSKMCPGKKDFVRKGKLKVQRRILLDSMKNLFRRFMNENSFEKLSYTTFTRSRPFWVTAPKARDRETCSCIKHDNFQFLITALKHSKTIKENNSHNVLEQLVCSVKNENCMLNLCTQCKFKDITFSIEKDEVVKYYKWETINEDRTIKGQTKKIKRVMKKEKNTSISELVDQFKASLPLFKKHVFNMSHQIFQLKYKKLNLRHGELIFHIDFSQNYIAKFGTEIQSMHFGASKKQISLHTGVLYHMDNCDLKAESFCTVSDNLDHHCHGVWAHLRPILEQAADKFPETHTVHFFSDSPSSQYRNKGNLFLMRKLLPTFFKGLKSFSWNFSEPGHGKGSMDGVGGTVKRSADKLVSYGQDIKCAGDIIKYLKEKSTIKLIEISDEEILSSKASLPTKLPFVKGIMKIRQLTYGEGKMHGRSLSCFTCPLSKTCIHYHLLQIPNSEEKPNRPTTALKRPSTSKRTVLKVEDVYSSSDEDVKIKKEESLTKIVSPLQFDKTLEQGTYVVVSFENVSKKSKDLRNFVGIVQSTVEDNEVTIMFMKNCSKDTSMFFTDENDVADVSVSQILGVLPSPTLVLKGNRVFYKFKGNIDL